METFSVLLAVCEGNHMSLVDSFLKGQWCRDVFFDVRQNKWLKKTVVMLVIWDTVIISVMSVWRHCNWRHCNDDSSWKMTLRFYVMAADDLVTQGARASAVMVLT